MLHPAINNLLYSYLLFNTRVLGIEKIYRNNKNIIKFIMENFVHKTII